MIMRRKLLVELAGITTIGMPIGYCFLGKNRSNQWAFLKRNPPVQQFYNATEYKQGMKNCIVLGPERTMIEGSEMANNFVKK